MWGYYIGGYQVIKKWLSYREQDLLGRSLTQNEAREVMNMARSLAAIVLIKPALKQITWRLRMLFIPGQSWVPDDGLQSGF